MNLVRWGEHLIGYFLLAHPYNILPLGATTVNNATSSLSHHTIVTIAPSSDGYNCLKDHFHALENRLTNTDCILLVSPLHPLPSLSLG